MSGTGGFYVPQPAAPRAVWAAAAVTDGSGVATFTYPAGLFTAAPVAAVEIQGGNGNAKFHKITSNTPAGCTVQVLQAAGVTLLGIGVLAASVPEAGVTVHLHATTAG
jgi:hypothetical protein